MSLIIKKQRHAPTHWQSDNTIYFITGAIYKSRPLLEPTGARECFVEIFLKYIEKYQWQLYEWVVLPNHYHFLARIPVSSEIPGFINTMHKTSAFQLKKMLHVEQKPFWYQYWDRCIRTERQFYQTVVYILYNPIKHGYVKNLRDYQFSSFHHYKNQEEQLRRNFVLYAPQKLHLYDDLDEF